MMQCRGFPSGLILELITAFPIVPLVSLHSKFQLTSVMTSHEEMEKSAMKNRDWHDCIKTTMDSEHVNFAYKIDTAAQHPKKLNGSGSCKICSQATSWKMWDNFHPRAWKILSIFQSESWKLEIDQIPTLAWPCFAETQACTICSGLSPAVLKLLQVQAEDM